MSINRGKTRSFERVQLSQPALHKGNVDVCCCCCCCCHRSLSGSRSLKSLPISWLLSCNTSAIVMRLFVYIPRKMKQKVVIWKGQICAQHPVFLNFAKKLVILTGAIVDDQSTLQCEPPTSSDCVQTRKTNGLRFAVWCFWLSFSALVVATNTMCSFMTHTTCSRQV